MPEKQFLPLLLASLFAASTAHATIELIAVGSVSGSYEDFATETAGPLENGGPGNRLGGLGSGLAYPVVIPSSRGQTVDGPGELAEVIG